MTAVPAHADDPSTLADRLAQVQQEQARQAQRFNALQAQQGQVRQTLAGLQALLTQSNADLAPIAAQAQAIEAQIADAQVQLSHDQLAYLQHMRAFQTDIKKLYALGGMRWFEFVFSARSFDDLLNRTIYLQQMSVSELQLARRLRAERDSLLVSREIAAVAPSRRGGAVPPGRKVRRRQPRVEQQRYLGVEAFGDQALQQAGGIAAHPTLSARALQRPDVEQNGGSHSPTDHKEARGRSIDLPLWNPHRVGTRLSGPWKGMGDGRNECGLCLSTGPWVP